MMTTELDFKFAWRRSLRTLEEAHALILLLMLVQCGNSGPPSASSVPPGSGDMNNGASSGSSVAPSTNGSGGSGGSGATSGSGGTSGSGSSSGVATGSSSGTNNTGGSGSSSGSSSVVQDAGVTIAADGGSGTTGDSSVACNPADKKPDPTPVSISMIMGYSQYTTPPTTGPFMPVIETDPGLPNWTVYRPSDLGGMPHPILVWAEGGCLQDGTLYGQYLLQAASFGFVAIADGVPTDPSADPGSNGIRGAGAGGAPQTMTIDWITAENERACSQYYHKLNVEKIAVSGQSCGGIMSLSAAADKRVTTAIINNSGLFSPDQTVYSALHTPIAYFIGGSSDIAYNNAESDYMNINNVPLFNANDPVGHGATWSDVNGGEFGRVNIGWLQWQLMDDMTAAKMFVGPNCELCTSTVWTVKKKMIP